jgi:hypothetical protein
MTLWTLMTWLGRRCLGQPLAWLFIVICASAPSLSLALGPVGVASDFGRVHGSIYEVAFVSAMAGVLWGMGRLEEITPLLRRVVPVRVLAIEVLVLALPAAVCVAMTLVPNLLIAPRATAIWTQAWPGALWPVAHLVAIALLLRKLPLASEVRSIALPTLAWVVPALLDSSSPVTRTMKTVLDATQDLPPQATAVPWTASVAPIIALVLLASSLDLLRRRAS